MVFECSVPGTPTELKSDRVSDERKGKDEPNGVGARDVYATKNPFGCTWKKTMVL